jgi:hypothetical protein
MVKGTPMSDTTRTTKDLAAMFDSMVDTMASILKDGEETVTKDGDVVRCKPKAATLGVIRQFLRDQNINASPEHHDGLSILATKFRDAPFAPDEDSADDNHMSH